MTSRARPSVASLSSLLLLGLCTLHSPIGCAGTTPPPEVVEEAYAGPPISIEGQSGSHVVIAESPSPGWSFKLDRLFEGYRHQGAYVSLTRPNPAFSYPQVVVQQRLATAVLKGEPIKVYVRIVDFQGESSTGDGYVLAAQAAIPGTTPVPTPTPVKLK